MMNFFKALYCNQYYELKPKGKEASARDNGTRLLTVSVALNIIFLVVLVMVFSEDFVDTFDDLLKDIFGRRKSRSMGKFVALIPFLISYPLIRYTLGRQESYDALIESFERLQPDEQKRISKKGLNYFIASMIGFGVSFALIMIFLV